jgi:hypothetical protein
MTEPDSARFLHPGHAPTPFTAAQIRVGCPPGRRVTTRTVTADGRTWLRVSEFTDCDDEGAVVVSNEGRHRVTWVDLQGHASFPLATTMITKEAIDTPVGSHECLRYTVADDEGTEEKDGTVVSTTTMISNEIPRSPAD